MSKSFNAGVALTALSVAIGGQAFAQSTGTQQIEEQEIVVTAAKVRAIDGFSRAEAPKSRSSITQEYISTQVPGQTVFDTINLLPGVNFTNNDAYGSAGGDLTLRGLDSQRLALLQDGVPLNDSGNYAVYPNQQLDSDLISKVDVNLGTTDVDSPTAAAAGGTINYITRVPQDNLGGRIILGGGTESYQNYYGVLETGRFGPWGTKGWLSARSTENALFVGVGEIKKKQYNGRLYQDIGERGDFASLSFNYNENRNNFIRRATLAQFNTRAIPVYDNSCARPTPVAGTAQNEATTATGFTAICANYVGNNINPSNTGNVRGQFSYHLADDFILTVDPSYQYVLANGGGRTIFAENDPQLRTPTDLNGDGDTLDRVLLYWPNTTNTNRIGVTSSLIWTFAERQSLRVAYTYDNAHHRQTGEATRFDQNGDPLDVFGGKDGYGPPVNLSDGYPLRRRDRASAATLNQFAAEYRGRIADDRLLINAGLRAPFFDRQLNNYCYMRDTFNAYCTTQTGTVAAGTTDGGGVPLVTFPASSQAPSATTQFGQPRKFERKYDKLLPNLGASYDFTDAFSAYASYAETLSAPRTDDLYDQKLVNPNPETTKAYDFGLRYQTPKFLASGAVFYNDFNDRIERQFDEAANNFFSINVGQVILKGFDGQVVFRPIKALSLFASYSYVESELQSNFPNGAGGAILLTKGKELFETPKTQGAVRGDWDVTKRLKLGMQGKFVGARWANLTNTEKSPSYKIWDFDARFKIIPEKRTYVQFNIKNMFDERYLGDISTSVAGSGSYQPGVPRTYVGSLQFEF
ncbi:MAG: TonB-dependent receptor [Pseudomonadota bacterium]